MTDFPIEMDSPDVEAAPMQSETVSNGIPQYRGPEMKCGNCAYFADDMCLKFDKPCDFDGSCPAFEGGDDD